MVGLSYLRQFIRACSRPRRVRAAIKLYINRKQVIVRWEEVAGPGQSSPGGVVGQGGRCGDSAVTWRRAWRPGRYSGDGDGADGSKILRGWDGERRSRSSWAQSPSGHTPVRSCRNIEGVLLQKGHKAVVHHWKGKQVLLLSSNSSVLVKYREY